MLIFQTVVNIGMCLFVMPVIGLTLPFFSYGGSSLLTLYAAMGVVSGIKKRSPVVRRPGAGPWGEPEGAPKHGRSALRPCFSAYFRRAGRN